MRCETTIDSGRRTGRRGAGVLVRAVSATLAGGAVLVGCAGSPPPVPSASSSTPAPVGVPSSPQNNVSAYPVIERLGRWDGNAFVPLAPDEITGGNVIVMSHGWAPGFEETYETLQRNSTSLVTFWDPALADPATGVAAGARFEALAGALQSADSEAQILMFSWVDQSATSLAVFAAAAAERAAEVNGHRMAAAIDEVLADEFVANGGELHLIGHSFGANVAATAATAVGTLPRQLTLFDSPETSLARFGGAGNTLQYKLSRLPVGRGADEVFIDNYISEVGEPYAGEPGLSAVVDVRLAPPEGSSGAARHEFPIGWYAQSTASTSAVGYRWSPMSGAAPSPIDTAQLGSAYLQEQAATPLVLTEVAGPPPRSVHELVALQYQPLEVPAFAATQTPTVAAVLDGGTVTVADIAFTTDASSLWLEFDLAAELNAGDSVSVYVDGRQRWFGVEGDPRASGTFVTLYDVEPGDHRLSIVLAGADGVSAAGPGSRAVVSGLRIASADDIVRDAEPTRSRTILYVVFAGVVLIAAGVVAAIGALVYTAVARVSRGRRRVRQ